ncbi:MAG: hypothetical protein H6732_16295 [Alphaproteobacteria bacterium]|nr:hypothetical protein [Alphaproteobacteria bacterium]
MWWLLASSLALGAEGWDWRFELGGELDARPNAIVEVGARKGDVALELLTSHLRASWTPSWSNGKAWISVDVEPGTAGMFFERWVDGEPRGDLSTLAFAAGATGGVQRFLPLGFYVGLEGQSSFWWFVGLPDVRPEDVPTARPFHTADAVVGFHRPWLQVWVRGGVDWTGGAPSPHVEGRLATDIPLVARPLLVVHTGWADATDEVSRTRVGGNNPYSIPLAGASWAEFWAEDYLAIRLGVEGGPVHAERNAWRVRLAADVVWADAIQGLGFGTTAGFGLVDRGRFVEAAVGWAPWLRSPGQPLALSAWVRAGVTWGKGLKPRT